MSMGVHENNKKSRITLQYNDLPIVTVIIPAYNAGRFIEQCLKSVFSQSLRDIEVIVVDDGSTDDTRATLDKIEDPRLRILGQDNAGVSAARNAGIRWARSEFILFLDADDILAPDALARHVAALEAHPDAILTYGEAPVFFTEQGLPKEGATLRAGLFQGRPHGDVLQKLLVCNPITTGAALVRLEVVKQSRGFPVAVRLGEDWVFWCEIAAHGSFVWLGPEPVAYYRQHGESAARRLGLETRGLWPAIDSIFSLPAVTERFSQRERAHLRRKCESHALAYSAQERIKIGHWQEGRQAFLQALARRPLMLRTWILLTCALLKYIPPPIRRRLK